MLANMEYVQYISIYEYLVKGRTFQYTTYNNTVYLYISHRTREPVAMEG